MGRARGRVIEIRLGSGRQMEACIACPVGSVPQPGQYLLASVPGDEEAPLGVPLFMTEKSTQWFWAASPIPLSWIAGSNLDLEGPLGNGFALPREVQRLGLIALGDTASRLMPLVYDTGATRRGMTLFTDLPLPSIPASLEAYPLASLADALDWPDFMVIDLPVQRLVDLRSVLGFTDREKPGFPGQALVTLPMPCAGLARCGACAVPTHRGWKLACEDGPVFELNDLKW